jgi:hypothetical protein
MSSYKAPERNTPAFISTYHPKKVVATDHTHSDLGGGDVKRSADNTFSGENKFTNANAITMVTEGDTTQILLEEDGDPSTNAAINWSVNSTFGDVQGEMKIRSHILTLQNDNNTDALQFSGSVGTFSAPPVCSVAATSNNQLVNKSYVDTNSVSLSASNTFTGTKTIFDNKVGIGIDNPQRNLTIYHADNPAIQLTNSSSGTGASQGLELKQSGVTSNIYNREDGGMNFWTNNSQRFQIANDGDIRVVKSLNVDEMITTRDTHTATTNGPYHTSGFTSHYVLAGHTNNGTSTLRVGTYDTATTAITHNYERLLTGQSNYLGGIDFERSGAESGLMRVRGGFVNASGLSYSTSDDRVKHNEKVITDGISIVKQMIPKTYDMTDDMYDASYNGPLNKYVPSAGYIAQDIQAIADLSFCVIDTSEYDESGNLVKLHPLALNYTALMPYHTAAIKQQQEQIKVEKAKTASLEAQMASLLERVAALET